MQEREKTPPSEQQLNKLLEAVSNSQRNYRELIDSMDEVVIGVVAARDHPHHQPRLHRSAR